MAMTTDFRSLPLGFSGYASSYRPPSPKKGNENAKRIEKMLKELKIPGKEASAEDKLNWLNRPKLGSPVAPVSSKIIDVVPLVRRGDGTALPGGLQEQLESQDDVDLLSGMVPNFIFEESEEEGG